MERPVTVAVVGMGYVGLPLAVEFGKKMPTVGFDIDPLRVLELLSGRDRTLEITRDELLESVHLHVSHDVTDLRDANVYIVTVPTPIDEHKRPDLGPLRSASRTVGGVLQHGDTVVSVNASRI